MENSHNLLEKICDRHGITFFGVASLEKEPTFEHFKDWIKEDKHAEMRFLERYQEFREDPSRLEPEFDKAIVLGFNYFLGDKYGSEKSISKSRTAQYARFADYHKLLKKKSDLIIEDLKRELSLSELPFRALVDSAPVLERAIAVKSGKGFIGKNTVFISPDKGSFFLLFEILTGLDLELSETRKIDKDIRDKESGGCGSCKRCQVHCPTDALSKEYVLDARKCIAYYTIEHRGVIPLEYWQHLKLYYFGCDICQLVCPYNRNSKISSDIKVKVPDNLDLYDVALMGQADYEGWFGGTPMTRAKIGGLKRNALIYLAVANDSRLDEVVERLNGYSELIDATIAQIHEFRKLK